LKEAVDAFALEIGLIGQVLFHAEVVIIRAGAWGNQGEIA
jgi:hypothetical protein